MWHNQLHLGKNKCMAECSATIPRTAFLLYFASDWPHQDYCRPDPVNFAELPNLGGKSLKHSSDLREVSSIQRLSPKQNG